MNPDDLSRFAQRADEGPVCMLNLLRFCEGGAELYAKYARAVEPMLSARGGRAIYMGRGAELLLGSDDQRWDLVALIEYPKRAALLDMVQSHEYQAISHLRTDALKKSVLFATDPLLPPTR
ncbi:MAG: DUF1330 domain-containing protein [Polyangiaceae bacterium]|nr:DUF1330 domain-containing protein [Myxococcales bacterium]MCB9583995.1 DUF1330 domain-containing protein [Polyangiaceae bacterium]MCB9607749.1 DUF1330 domain-containing protein [Polyangiaceae bacterium]